MHRMQLKSTNGLSVCLQRLPASAPADRGVCLALLAPLMMLLCLHWFGLGSILLLFFFFFNCSNNFSAPECPRFPKTNPASTFLASCYWFSWSPKTHRTSTQRTGANLWAYVPSLDEKKIIHQKTVLWGKNTNKVCFCLLFFQKSFSWNCQRWNEQQTLQSRCLLVVE